MDLENKYILITGGSRGIGKATALAFAEKGATVGINYHSDDEAADTTLGLLKGKNHKAFKYDIANREEVRRLVQDFINTYGTIDVLVNNAGVSAFHSVEDDFEAWDRAWDKILNVNLKAAAGLTYWASREMIRHGGGRIINVSSRGAFRGEPTKPAYAASKAALNAFSQSMAKALAHHKIYVFAVAPGFTETDMAKTTLTERERERLMEESPFKRMAQPEEVAHAIVYFASEGAEYSSGAILDINGASYLRT
ncbi:SDR family oxidoreductase [Saccharicrinis sp. FJH54]|uniref:SDR family oxidoreductase n=1 Tax=Saccharicrinis sp. FJH54 TaxID=3344665 RepID=UPI0035D4049E